MGTEKSDVTKNVPFFVEHTYVIGIKLLDKTLK